MSIMNLFVSGIALALLCQSWAVDALSQPCPRRCAHIAAKAPLTIPSRRKAIIRAGGIFLPSCLSLYLPVNSLPSIAAEEADQVSAGSIGGGHPDQTERGAGDGGTPPCDDACLEERRRRVEERRAMMRQSRSSTSRQEVFDLSRQRAKLYDAQSRAASCIDGIPCY